jgi:hypothetical protein
MGKYGCPRITAIMEFYLKRWFVEISIHWPYLFEVLTNGSEILTKYSSSLLLAAP